jgi:hypothetical protein
MRALMMVAVVVALAACGQTTTQTTQTPVAQTPAMPETAADATAQDICGASHYTSLIGSSFAAVTFPAGANIRIIQPNQPVTHDFSAQRLNVIVDANGSITSLECY